MSKTASETWQNYKLTMATTTAVMTTPNFSGTDINYFIANNN